jgi:hypothetical protein
MTIQKNVLFHWLNKLECWSKVLVRHKHSSLLDPFVSYEKMSVVNTVPDMAVSVCYALHA